MPVERISLLHEDYILVTERFKALWTFEQFLRGIRQTFLRSETESRHDFSKLYEEIRSAGEQVHAPASAEVCARLREISERLDRIAASLRSADRSVSPSFVRRFFEKVRPQDDETGVELLRFYFSQPDTDEDVVDKVNFLVTVAAAGGSDPSSSAARPKAELRRLIESVTSSSQWPRPSDHEAAAIAYVVNEVAVKIMRARSFEELMSRGLLEEFRAVKRKIGGALVHPDVLMALASANLLARAAFDRLFRSEEKMLAEATDRIGDLERKLRHGVGEDVPLPEELRRFRERRDRLERGALDSNVRATDVVRLKTAVGDVLERLEIQLSAEPAFDGGAAEVSEDRLRSPDDETFWKPVLARVLDAVGVYDDGRGPLRTDVAGLAPLRLEPWELRIARRVVAEGGEPRSERDRSVLRAVALRFNAEEETAALRADPDGPRSLELQASAQESIARAPALDALISRIIAATQAAKLSEQARACARTRYRLMRAIADLWLVQDEPGAGGRPR